MNYDLIKRILEAFESEGVRYKIFGAVALNLHGLARATEDLDVFIEPTEDNVARLKAALFSVFEDPHIEEISADELLGEYPAIQYVPPENSFHIDILTRLGEVYSFADLGVLRIDLRGLQVTVVTPEVLFEMKKSTIRLKDRADAERLMEKFGLGS